MSYPNSRSENLFLNGVGARLLSFVAVGTADCPAECVFSNNIYSYRAVSTFRINVPKILRGGVYQKAI